MRTRLESTRDSTPLVLDESDVCTDYTPEGRQVTYKSSCVMQFRLPLVAAGCLDNNMNDLIGI